MELKEFDRRLRELIYCESLRPFVCRWSPFAARLFIVGYNPGTALGFSPYWNPERGFDKDKFLGDYLKKHRGRYEGARAEIEATANSVGQNITMDTNIYAFPTKKSNQLPLEHKRTEIFRFLIDTIRPRVVLVHGNKAFKEFQKLCISELEREELQLQCAVLDGHRLSFLWSPHLSVWNLKADPIANSLKEALKRGGH